MLSPQDEDVAGAMLQALCAEDSALRQLHTGNSKHKHTYTDARKHART
jgi:ribosomal protein RSM22 (predicted rRNA methylase)